MMAHVGAGSVLPAPFCLGLGLLLACGAPDQRAAVPPFSTLAAASDVATIVEETPPSGSALAGLRTDAAHDSLSWALQAIGGREGLDGHGIVVGIIDAGASGLHEQLHENYRGGNVSWFNPVGQTSTPT